MWVKKNIESEVRDCCYKGCIVQPFGGIMDLGTLGWDGIIFIILSHSSLLSF